jgi:hypothetical protein
MTAQEKQDIYDIIYDEDKPRDSWFIDTIEFLLDEIEKLEKERTMYEFRLALL